MVRVLVISESVERAAAIRAGLRLAGHELTEILGAEDALAPALQRARPDAIVLEAQSPTIDQLDPKHRRPAGPHACPACSRSAATCPCRPG